MRDSEGSTRTASTSASLICQVKAGDAEAWQRLARLYSPLVYRWARETGLQDSDAAEVLQNVFLAVFRGLERFHHDQPQDSFRGWLWTITRNEVRRLLHERAQQPDAVGGSDAQRQLQQLADECVEPSSSEHSAEDGEVFHRALMLIQTEFEQRTWQAFWRASVAEQTAAEIAHDLGMSEGAVRQAKYRVLTRLRTLLEGCEPLADSAECSSPGRAGDERKVL